MLDVNLDQFSDYIVFVDETGDHGMANINHDFPVFGLAFCVFAKQDYINHATPSLRQLKFTTFGHDMIILHEHDIRKKEGAFSRLSRLPREAFLQSLNVIIAQASFSLVAVIIDKRAIPSPAAVVNPYHVALKFGLERVFELLVQKGQNERMTHIVVEARGKREDGDLETEFRHICDGNNDLAQPLPFRLILADKRTNSEGLQLADMVARPVALSVLRPDQPNRAMEILRPKLWRGANGQVENNGLKLFPGKNEEPPGNPSSPSPNG